MRVSNPLLLNLFLRSDGLKSIHMKIKQSKLETFNPKTWQRKICRSEHQPVHIEERERERDGERERERERQTETERDRERQRETDRETDRQKKFT